MDRGTLVLIIAAVLAVVVLVLGTAFAIHASWKSRGLTKPPGPSVDEIYAHIKPALVPWENAVAQGQKDLDPEEKTWVMDTLSAAVALYEGADNGRRALVRLANDVRELVREARKAENWELALTGTDIFGVFRQDNFFMSFYRDILETQLARPDVTLKGFLDDIEMEDTYAFLEMRLRGSDEVISMQVREGEEFLDPPHTLQFVEIIGRNRGVKLEFLAIPGDTFEVMLRE